VSSTHCAADARRPASDGGLFDVPDVARNRKRAELVRRAFERGAVSP